MIIHALPAKASTLEEDLIMHMADALISPAVGGVAWAGAAGLAAYSARKLRLEMDDRKAPLMGVLGAFVFSAQMINSPSPERAPAATSAAACCWPSCWAPTQPT